jgi:hypothetical protein
MFFNSIVRSISCTDEKNQNNRVRSSSRFTSKLLELGCRNRRWLFPRKIGPCKTDEKQPATGRSGLGSLITFARDPRLCYENYFPIDFA